MKRHRVLVLALLLITPVSTTDAEPPTGPADGLPDSVAVWTVDGGAGYAAGGTIEIEATIGQPDASAHLAWGLALDGGFWGRPIDDGAIFRDDLESGTTDEWSATVGGTP